MAEGRRSNDAPRNQPPLNLPKGPAVNHNLRRRAEALTRLLADFPTLPRLTASFSDDSPSAITLQPDESGDIAAIQEVQDILGAAAVTTAYSVDGPNPAEGHSWTSHDLAFVYAGERFELFTHVREWVSA